MSFIPSTEAEWFFDSWYAKSAAIVYKESRKEEYLNDSVQFMNRSLAQITGENMIGANGRSVPEMALPKAITISTSQELCMKRQALSFR